MDPDDPEIPDIDALFAPLPPKDAFSVVLSEAHDVLGQVREPIDAELWGSDMIGALSESVSDLPSVMEALATTLVPAAEEAATAESLALLRVFGAVGDAKLRGAATSAADRLAAGGLEDPAWAAKVGAPEAGECWHYSDVGGRQESISMSFSYGIASHALSVLVDHGRGGKIKDAWVGDAKGLLAKTRAMAEQDPLVIFETIGAGDARFRLQRAISAGECPDQQDQIDDVAAHRALLYARMDRVAAD
jgi:hypothetical protein